MPPFHRQPSFVRPNSHCHSPHYATWVWLITGGAWAMSKRPSDLSGGSADGSRSTTDFTTTGQTVTEPITGTMASQRVPVPHIGDYQRWWSSGGPLGRPLNSALLTPLDYHTMGRGLDGEVWLWRTINIRLSALVDEACRGNELPDGRAEMLWGAI